MLKYFDKPIPVIAWLNIRQIYDPASGIIRKAWVFVMVLAYSRHMFCRTVFNQKTEPWIRLHIEAFESFEGVVETVVRAAFAVDEAAQLNRSYREMAKHYGFKIDPTPIYSPEKKGKVEAGVKYAKRNFFKPRQFEDIDDSNSRLDKWVQMIAGTRIHGTTGRKPLDVFEREEKGELLALPTKRFEPIIWKEASVHRDGRIQFERQTYPVPWRFIGKRVWIRATRLSVEVYFDDVRIAFSICQILPSHKKSHFLAKLKSLPTPSTIPASYPTK